MTAPAPSHRSRQASPEVQAYFEALAASPGPHVHVRLLGLRTYDTAGLHQKVKQGLSFAALEHLRRALDLPVAAMATLLHIPLRTIHRRKDEGRLRPDESDRLVRLARLLARALELFEGDVDATRLWLETPLTALGGARPIELAETDPGASEVETLIGRLEHGVFA